MNNGFRASHFFALGLEFFRGSGKNWEGIKAHWDEGVNVRKEVAGA